ncbi:MAG: glycosyltransferase [Candidatus Micrarchaeota archaeon]|nr:glycosyltransferase [Candidatus Micrarchaeota archaeon]
MPKFSIIIPTFNEEALIARCLQSVSLQDTDVSYEIIVADSNSTDNTVGIAEKYADKVVLCPRGIAVGRNAGAKAARGKYLVFMDGDSVASKGLVEAYNDAFSDARCIAATGPILPLERMKKYEDLLVRAGAKLYTKKWMKLLILLGKPAFIGSNSAFRKDKFFEVGGFNERLVTFEDGDLSMRLAGRGNFAFHEDAVVYTSIRRLKKWGYIKFVGFHASNTLRYLLMGRSHSHYEEVR